MEENNISPEQDLIYRIVEQWGNVINMPRMEGWLKEYARKREPGPAWVKATTRLPEKSGQITWRWIDKEAAYSGYDDKRGFIYDKGGASVDPLYYIEIEWLDESGTAPAVTPTFWDVAKAFKWAAEYRDEIGGQLTLYNDQWTLISEDEDGNENDTKDLTPGNVAELYCLQNGFNKENEGTTAAGREEDAVALIKFIRLNYRRRKDVWTDNFNIAKLTDEGILGLFKQQKEK